MNVFIRQNHTLPFFLFLVTNIVIAMDLPYPQLQLAEPNKQIIIQGNLFIDPKENLSLYPHHTCKKNHPVEYLTQQSRQAYPYTAQWKRLPLHTPFVHIIIEPTTMIAPEGALPKDILPQTAWNIKRSLLQPIYTVIPATQFIPCNDGSKMTISSQKCISGTMLECVFRLTCTKNDNLAIKRKYFPNDKQGNTFETQFLSCMNQFYAKPSYCQYNPNIPELIQNNVLRKEATDRTVDALRILQMIGDPFLQNPLSREILNTTYIYKHGIHGSSSSNDLMALATNRTTKAYNNSLFNLAMNRQHSPSRVQQKPPSISEARRLKCYHNYMENVKHFGNKLSMEETVAYSKNPALDVPNKIAPAADSTPDQAMLETILEDCLMEFAIQETVKHVGNKSPMAKTIHSSKSPSIDVPNKIVHAKDALPNFFPSDDKKNHMGNECIIL